MAEKRAIATMTWPEAQAALAGAPTVLLPMGSLENQGPHVLMGDYLCAEALAARIAEAASARDHPTLVAPVLPFGCDDNFGNVKGGITLAPETLTALLADVLDALARAGAGRIVILNGHGGNVPVISAVTRRLHRAGGPAVPSLYLWKIAFALMVEAAGPDIAKTGGHGANPLASVAMHLFPEHARPDRAPAPRPLAPFLGLPASGYGGILFEGVEIDAPYDNGEVSGDGVVGGDPRACSAQLGGEIAERLVALATRFLLHLADRRGF